nr:uncharacterized protein LOC124806814 [Hydra vulgaris]
MLLTFLTYMLLIAMFQTAPIVYQPCPISKHEDPMLELKILLENYIVIKPSIEKVLTTSSNNEYNKKNLFHFHTFSNKKPVCEIKSIKIPDLLGKVTIPENIMEVILVNSLNANKCKKVKKEILYLEEVKDCNKHINARMYVLKTREIVVAYEHMI